VRDFALRTVHGVRGKWCVPLILELGDLLGVRVADVCFFMVCSFPGSRPCRFESWGWRALLGLADFEAGGAVCQGLLRSSISSGASCLACRGSWCRRPAAVAVVDVPSGRRCAFRRRWLIPVHHGVYLLGLCACLIWKLCGFPRPGDSCARFRPGAAGLHQAGWFQSCVSRVCAAGFRRPAGGLGTVPPSRVAGHVLQEVCAGGLEILAVHAQPEEPARKVYAGLSVTGRAGLAEATVRAWWEIARQSWCRP
jgi:hypothetical protein